MLVEHFLCWTCSSCVSRRAWLFCWTKIAGIVLLSVLSVGNSMYVSVLAPREEAESGLEFLGLLVMENRLKQETKPVLRELAAAHIRNVMVTGKSPRLLLWLCWLPQDTQERDSLLQHPPLHVHGLYLGCHRAMADVRSLPLLYPFRGQLADSCHGGQERGYDSHGQQSHPHRSKRTGGLCSSFHCLAIGRRLQRKHSCSLCKHSQGWLLLSAKGN